MGPFDVAIKDRQMNTQFSEDDALIDPTRKQQLSSSEDDALIELIRKQQSLRQAPKHPEGVPVDGTCPNDIVV